MTTQVPRVGLAVLVGFVVFTVVTIVVLLPLTGGPRIGGTDHYTVRASFEDTQGLISNGKVLMRGVEVGRVGEVSVQGRKAIFELDLERRFAPLYRDATARIGQRSVIGDAYVDLTRGSPAAGRLTEGGTIAKVLPTVEFDEAYTTFDRPTRAHIASTLRTFGRSALSDQSPRQWGETVTQLSRTVRELRTLSGNLRGQERDISALVRGSRTAFAELGSRERALAALVSGGRQTLQVFADRPAEFGAGLRELPRFLSTARRTLDRARPLLIEARPLVNDLSAAAPELQVMFRELRPTAVDASRLVDGLPRFNRTAVPFMREALPTMRSARPYTRALAPILSNLVPIARYASPRAPELAAWFTSTLGASQSGDSISPWARFAFFNEPGSQSGQRPEAPGSFFDINTVTEPLDAVDPQSDQRGDFPRLMPFKPVR